MTTPSAERGNIFFYILLGIVLFSALAYAVSRNRIGNTGVSDQKAKLYASEIISYANQVNDAVNRLRLRGCKENEISFENSTSSLYPNSNAPTDKSCHVFGSSIGNLSFTSFPAEAFGPCCSGNITTSLYRYPFFSGFAEVYLIGTSGVSGGNGTVSTADLKLIVFEINKNVCMKINEQLGVTSAGTAPPTTCGTATNSLISAPFTGTYLAGSGCTAKNGFLSACMNDATIPPSGSYYFYRVLLPR